MARKEKPTSSNQWADLNKECNDNYTLFGLTCERPENINLRPQEALLVQMLKQGSVTTHQARALGIMNPSTRIGDLRKKGAIIDVEYKDIVDQGIIHKGVASYNFVGWKLLIGKEGN